ncbi:MAG: hypothetical protein AABW47_00530 [Nanoarchaeota archaeon]
MEYKNIEEIQDKIHKSFTKSLVKKGLQNMSTGIIRDKKHKIKFLEVIINDRNQRYSNPSIMKKIPKTYKGIKVKTF